VYIDAKKFDYSKFSYSYAERLVERDKDVARESYRKWINEAVDGIVDRQWEVIDVGAIEQVGDFVKLLKEAEFTYSLGAYTSAIALVGVCSEDICRFFATSAGHNLDGQNQHSRVNTLLRLGVISQNTSDKFHIIRQLRNDCLHYNAGFKQKDSSALKIDALTALNSLKEIYANLAGVVDYNTVDPSRVLTMIDVITREAGSNQPGALGVNEAVARMRNVFGGVFGFDLSMNHRNPIYKTSLYRVEEIDTDMKPSEMTLRDMTNGLVVIVDISDAEIAAIEKERILEGDVVAATVMSVPDDLEITGTWRLWSTIRKMG